tara:strand:- start:3506 stop:4057 length:552 start_codon:yes stop_codon:yes gene_type:complete
MAYVLGCDPGIANFGYALVELGRAPGDDRLHELGVITTKPSAKKRNVRQNDDINRRLTEIVADLHEIVREYRVMLVCTESFSPPRHSGTAAKLGMVFGSLNTLCLLEDLPLLSVSPQDIKHAVTGSRSASKADIESVLRKRDADAGRLLDRVTASKREHPVDAWAAIRSCEHDAVLKMVRRSA